ncbi:uncharacterized protein [Haliotis cracherodii]|uniref:uncharacterized protein n=1 Tax=Haliotis cracherodii TaxID=6455 RepID=UPI0039E9CC2B
MAEDEAREENVADIDFSQIRTSIQLGGRMIEQILNSVHYGSPEVRCLLLDECDIILECRVCRGLFRALPNFVAHKRVYCKQAYIMTHQSMFDSLPEDDVVVVQPTAPEDMHTKTDEDRTCHKSADDRVRDTITQINCGLLGKSEMYKLYSKAAEKVDRPKKTKKTLSVVLSQIASNSNAVRVSCEDIDEASRQSLFKVQAPACITEASTFKPEIQTLTDFSSPLPSVVKSDVMDDASVNLIQSDLNKNMCDSIQQTPTPLSPDILLSPMDIPQEEENISTHATELNNSEKIILRERKFEKGETNVSNTHNVALLKCLQCNVTYSSSKTLKYHIQKRHSGLRTFFPCPYCSNVFFYFWGLTRHLRVNHKKTQNQINKMRTILRESAFTKNVTKTCIQAKDQLEFTTDLKERCKTTEKVIENESMDEKKVAKEKRGKNVCTAATVKHTSKYVKHTFASRHVPLLDVPKKKVKTVQKYSHQLSCERCDKVFWKKGRLTNHKKYCSQTKVSSSSYRQVPQQNICSFCCKSFLRKSNLERHSVLCGYKSTTGSKIPKTSRNKANEADHLSPHTSLSFSCMNCNRTFGKRVSLENHKRSCWNESTVSKPICHAVDSLITDKEYKSSRSNRLFQNETVTTGENKIKFHQKSKKESLTESIHQDFETKRKRREATKHDKKLHVVEEIWIHKQPGRPSEKVKSNRIIMKEEDTDSKLHCLDSEKLSAIIDEAELKCQKCGQEFTSVSNIRRHAIRHLGWKRFKCKLCRFSSYNKSECNTHIMRTHSEKYRLSSVESLIVDLNRETSKIQTEPKLQSLNEKQTVDKQHTDAPQTRKTKQDKSREKDPDPARKFNISTRNSPRNFDTRPYQKCDNMTTLFTRKGYYPKPYLHLEGKNSYQVESQGEGNHKDASEGSKCMGYSMRSSRFTSKQSVIEKEGIHDNSNTELSSACQQYTVMKCGENVATSVESDSEYIKAGFEAVNENGDKEFVPKGRKKVPWDSNSSSSHSKHDKTYPKSNFQQEQRKTSLLDGKSQDFLAPWPRASEPMSVKEMFALIRRSPRAGSGRRKSTGDITVCHAPDTNYSEDMNVGVQPVATGRSSKMMDGKVKLSATLARKSSPGSRSVSLNQRTSRPGVDWSQNSEEK